MTGEGMTADAQPGRPGATLPGADTSEGEPIMTDPDETANLAAQLIHGYREHVAADAAAVPIPGQVLGSDIEGQADELAAAAARLGDLLTAFAREPNRSLDAIAVFQALSRTAGSMAAAATELHHQEWFDLEDGAEPEAIAAWTAALEGLRGAASTFKWVADGWI